MIHTLRRESRRLLLAWVCGMGLAHTLAAQPPRPLLPQRDALQLYERVVNLIESTGVAVPGLARAAAPVLENTRQSLQLIRQSTQQDSGQTYVFLINARSYLALADSVPKPYPFLEEGQKQFAELRAAIDRIDSHFRALLDQKEAQLRNADRDNIKRYTEANAKLQAPSKPRVVFLGDSITDGWRLNEYFPEDKEFINRGISGQITGEMLGRMKQDVLYLQPAAVLVLAGTNDLARGIPVQVIEDNLAMIAEIAVFNNVKPIFASVLPISDYHQDTNPAYAQSKRRKPNLIRQLNEWIKGMCEERHLVYVDYYSAMVDSAGFLPADEADDGLHPNAKGYRVMAPLALAAINKAVAPPPPAPVATRKKKKLGVF
jgi:lysophospholipase L1-like esterase